MEAIFRLLSCSIQNPLRIAFIYTACQPNWSLVLDIVFGVQEEVHVVIPQVNETELRTNSKLFLDVIYMKPNSNCSVIPILKITFFTPCLIFFVLSSLLRFYMIVASPANGQHERLAKPTHIIGFTIMGILVSMLCLGWSLSIKSQGLNLLLFVLACEAPDIEMHQTSRLFGSQRSSFAFSPFYGILVLFTLALILSITVIYKVKQATRVSADSRHFKLAVYTLSHFMGFGCILGTAILAKSLNSTNMTKVSVNFYHSKTKLI